VLSPHTDDGELGAGGTISRLLNEGSEVTYLAFSAPRKILKDECQESLKVLGVTDFKIFDFPVRHFPQHRQDILEILYKNNKENQIDLVLTPSTHDLHQDHQTVTKETLRAFKTSTILGYELQWNLIVSHENCFISLSEEDIEKKISACWKYQSQIELKRPYFNKKYIRSLARSRGLKIGKPFAESFEAIKLVIKSDE
jgi:LmbE family N-acetylglucosaminyl deacetylase